MTLNQIGNCLAQMGEAERAAARFSEALRLNPDYFEARFNLASAQLKLGRFDEAIEHYGRVLKAQPDFRPALEGIERAKAKKAAAKQP